MTSLLGGNGQSRVSFDSPYHEESNEFCSVSIDQLQRTLWHKNRIKVQNRKPVIKTEIELIEQNGCHFRNQRAKLTCKQLRNPTPFEKSFETQASVIKRSISPQQQ